MDDNISQERLQLIYEAALRQFRSGVDRSKVIVNLYSKGFEEDEAEDLANKAYAEYWEEKRQVELKENYDKPLASYPNKLFQNNS
jgi:hypothetical protein